MNAVTQTEARAVNAAAAVPLEAADPTKNMILVPLSRLVLRPTGRNVRKTPRMSIPELAASIQRVGLLQNLIVGAFFCCCSLASVVVEVPISGTTAMPVALVKGWATQVLKAVPQLPPYQATVMRSDFCAWAAPAMTMAVIHSATEVNFPGRDDMRISLKKQLMRRSKTNAMVRESPRRHLNV